MDFGKHNALSFLEESIKLSEHIPSNESVELARDIISATSIVPGVSLLNFRDGAICLQWAEQGVSVIIDDDIELYCASSLLATPNMEPLSHDFTKVVERLEYLLQTNKLQIN